MGIKGLSSYIHNYEHKFLKNYELHDITLVIDGNCVVNHFYDNRVCKYCYGGDYDLFACHVSEFFHELWQCNVKPIIVMDGGTEEIKFKTIYDRSLQRIKRASTTTPCNDQHLLPLLTKYVFYEIARENNIEIIQSTFEADEHIASLGRILNCPVLSNDSDFFIYDVMYIPYTTLKKGYKKSENKNKFVKYCKIFDKDNFLQEFSNMDKKLLPLVAVVLGNDYIKTNIFQNFFSSLEILETDKLNQKSEKFLQITVFLRWIQKHTLDTAITEIINSLDPEKQQTVLEIIEIIINKYLCVSNKMLHSLEYSSEEIGELMQKIQYEPYKFQKPYNYEISEESRDQTYLSWNKDIDNISSCDEVNIIKPEDENYIEKIVPSWFLYMYNKKKFPSYFMDMINRQHLIVAEQIEDFSYPACVNISLRIISIIHRLLSNGTTNSKILKYTARGKGVNLETKELYCNNYEINCDLPLLQNLKDTAISERKKIFLNTLDVLNESLIKFPPAWRLYIAAVQYWLNSSEKIFATNYHLYTLVLLIILHVVKTELRNGIHLNCKNNKVTEKNNCLLAPQVDVSIRDALEKITENDCYWAERSFRSYINSDKNNFDISIVHAFSLFQNCLKYSMDLNFLLGCPYPTINVADFFSGYLAYNLFNDLKSHVRLNQHICDIFEKSPNILQLFVSLSINIKTMLKNK